MDKPVFSGELEMPRFMQEGYEYLGEDEQWHIKDDAPEWAKREFAEFYGKLNPKPDEGARVMRF